jgi:hypothetical protein
MSKGALKPSRNDEMKIWRGDMFCSLRSVIHVILGFDKLNHTFSMVSNLSLEGSNRSSCQEDSNRY